VPTAYYFYNATLLGKMADVLGKPKDADKFRSLAAEIRDAYNQAFFDPEKALYNDGSQMANAFPLFLGIVEDKHESRVLENLVRDIRIQHDDHLTTGVLGTKYMIEALSKYGVSDVAWALATQTTYPSWHEMMARYTTVCEFWTLKQSKNHVMMGSIDAWFYKTLAGIKLSEEEPAFREIIIDPFPALGLKTAGADVASIRGLIRSKWARTDHGMRLAVTIPFNSMATVYLEGEKEAVILEDDRPIGQSGGITYIGYQSGKHKLRAASGSYRLEIIQS
jgi:alpha-L-rhamnosidase